MTARVWMRHPELPPEQLIEVDEASVPHHRSAGWVAAEPPPKPKPESDPEKTPDVGAAESEPADKPSRRRAPKEGEEK